MLYTPSVNYTPIDTVPAAGGDYTGFFENFGASHESYRTLDQSLSEFNVHNDAWDWLIKEIKTNMPERQFRDRSNISNIQSSEVYEDPNLLLNPNQYFSGPSFSPMSSANFYEKQSQKLLNIIKDNPNNFKHLGNVTEDTIKNKAIEIAQSAQMNYESVSQRATGLGDIGSFFGNMYGVLEDPVNLAAIAITHRPAAGLLKNAFREGIVASLSEAAIQGPVSQWYDKVGIPYDAETFWSRVGAAGGFSFAFTAGLGGMVKGFESLQKARAAQFGSEYTPDPLVESIKGANNMWSMVDEDNKLINDAGGIDHQSKLDQATIAVRTGDASKLPSGAVDQYDLPKDIYYFDKRQGFITQFEIDNLKLDPKTFQFKTEEGMLKGVKEWDNTKSGYILVYEKADGSQVILDGHQRVALARRVKAINPNADVQLYGMTIREVDDISADVAKAHAIGKNIAEGSVTAKDASKIFKTIPDVMHVLPPSSQLVDTVRGLMNLDKRAFKEFANGSLNEQYASLVGKMIADSKQQMIAMQSLIKAKPDNLLQAEQVIRQSRQVKELIDDDTITTGLFKEKAVIIDEISKILSNSPDLIKDLSNIINAGVKGATKDAYETIISTIKSNANIKGAIGDALSKSANDWKLSGRKSAEEFANEFKDNVVGAIKSGNYERLSAGERLINHGAKTEIGRFERPDTRGLDDFSDGIFSKGKQDQITMLEKELDDEIAANERMLDDTISYETYDVDGTVTVQKVSVADILDELDQDAVAAKAIKECVL